MSNQPTVTPTEIGALRFENKALKKQLKDQEAMYEAQIAELTKERDVAKASLKSYLSAKPLPKVVMRRPI